MANEFSLNERTKLIAGAVYENVPYVKKATSYMTQDQTKGKKNGDHFKIYIPDPGKTIDGIVADPDAINEKEVEVVLTAKNNSCTVNLWDELTNIEDFNKEIIKTRAVNLGQSINKACIEATVFNAAQAVVGSATPATLSEGSTMLDEIGVVGTRVAFLKPTTEGKITSNVKFYQGDEIQKEIYRRAYVGEFAGASVIREKDMPVVVGDGSSATVTFTPVSGEGAKSATVIGFEPLVSATGLKKGQPYKVDGLKIVDINGIQTDQDYVIIPTADNKFPEIRVSVDGEAHNNPNAWAASSFTGGNAVNMLTSGTSYYVGQVRTEDALGFDTYRFGRIPGTEQSEEDVKNIRINCTIGGDNIRGENSVVFRAPYAVTLPEARKSVLIYFEK